MNAWDVRRGEFCVILSFQRHSCTMNSANSIYISYCLCDILWTRIGAEIANREHIESVTTEEHAASTKSHLNKNSKWPENGNSFPPKRHHLYDVWIARNANNKIFLYVCNAHRAVAGARLLQALSWLWLVENYEHCNFVRWTRMKWKYE